jgi:hypothetical protein
MTGMTCFKKSGNNFVKIFISYLKSISTLKITEDVIFQYIMSGEYDKPKIEVGNYYLQWNEKSYGIPQKERAELKEFLNMAIQYLDEIYRILNSLERPRVRKKYRLANKLFPSIHIPYLQKDNLVKYDLSMMTDGSTFIDRIEKIEIIKEANESTKKVSQSKHFHHDLFLKWNLGELLFNRQGIVH